MANSTHQTSLRRTAWILGLLALVLSVSTVVLIHQYGATRPMVMDAGHTHAVRIHGRVVYLTNGEYAEAVASHALTIVAIGAFLVVLLKSRVRKS